MIAAEVQIKDVLTNSLAVTAIVNDRILADKVDQQANLPLVVYSRGDTELIWGLEGLQASRVMVDVVVLAKTREQANALALAVRGAADTASIGCVGQASEYVEEANEYISRLTFDVWEV